MRIGRERALMLAAGVLAGSGAAFAGEPTPTFGWINGQVPTVEDVRLRSRPDYDALGIRMGSFTVYPSVVTSIGRDSNVFALPSDDGRKTGDTYYKFKPEVFAKSNWSTHALTIYASGEFVGYGDFDQYNNFSGVVGADGIVDVSRNFRIGAGTRFERQYEAFGTGESFAKFDKPVGYDIYQGYLSANAQLQRLRVGVFGSVRRYDYDDVTQNGVLVDQHYRDHTTYEVATRVGYEISPSMVAFVQASNDWRDYDHSNLSNTGFNVVGGVELQLSRLVRGEAFAGYFWRNFQDASVRDRDGLLYGANVYWYVTPLMTLGATASRDVSETALGGSGSYTTDTIGVRADYELLRYLIVTGRLSYEHRAYNDVERTDNVVRSGVSVTYLVNRNVHLSADYTHTDSSSNLPTADYARDVVGVSMKVQY